MSRFLARLVGDHIDDLRNDVAGALNDHRIADADVATAAQFLAVAAYAPDVVLVVQRGVLHDDAADADRLELAPPASARRCGRPGSRCP